MPTINLPKRQRREGESQRNEKTPMRMLRQKAYQNTTWRKLRNDFIKMNPLCADCLNEGKVVPAEDIHHIHSPFKNGEINWALLLDPNNLVSLCKDCHGKRHAAENGYRDPQEIIDALDAFFNDIEDEDQ